MDTSETAKRDASWRAWSVTMPPQERQLLMHLEPWWYGRTPIREEPPLIGNATCDVAVVGAGVAGLHAALRLVDSGRDVVVLEKAFCGAGASGRSSGFLTPDSELELHDLIRRFGRQDAERLWNVAVDGLTLMVDTIRAHDIDCDLQQQDCLFVGIGDDGADRVAKEAQARASLGYSYQLYEGDELSAVNRGGYDAGIRYAGTYTIDPFRYCQRLKDVLRAKGVRVYERSEVRSIDGASLRLTNGKLMAGQVIVCISGMTRDFDAETSAKCYHAQTFLAVTEPLMPAADAPLPGRSAAVLGQQACLHLLSSHTRRAPAARRRPPTHHLCAA
jgi:glycine/D-amino acid oxidase-like deaminating enzyme